MHIVIAAKKNSRRLPNKNNLFVNELYTLFTWTFLRAKIWFPKNDFYIASDSEEILNFCGFRSCNLLFLSEDQVKDREDGEVPWLEEFIRCLPKPALLLDVTKPFTNYSDIQRAFADPRQTLTTCRQEDAVRLGETNHTWKYPKTVKAVGNFWLFKGRVPPWKNWNDEGIYVSNLTSMDVHDKEDLDDVRKILKGRTIFDF